VFLFFEWKPAIIAFNSQVTLSENETQQQQQQHTCNCRQRKPSVAHQAEKQVDEPQHGRNEGINFANEKPVLHTTTTTTSSTTTDTHHQQNKLSSSSKMVDSTDFIGQFLGPFGKWQLRTILIIYLCKIPSSWFMSCIIFSAPCEFDNR